MLLNVLFLFLIPCCCLCADPGFSLTIPIYFDIPKHLKFLIPKTQALLDHSLSQRKLVIDYNPKLVYGPGSSSYTVKLDYGQEEAYFISPFGKTITIYQTDYLIAFNKIHEFIAKVIEDFLLKSELDYFDEIAGGMNDNIAIDIGPTHDVEIMVISSRNYNWDNKLVEELFQPVINELQDLTYLNVQLSHISEPFKPVIYLDEIENLLNHAKLTFLIYLNPEQVEISGMNSNQIIIPKKGGVSIHKIHDDLDEMKQIDILEILTGQLFRLLGMNISEPKSPFIRIEFLMRRQIYMNYLKLSTERQIEINELLHNGDDWGEILLKTWEFLR